MTAREVRLAGLGLVAGMGLGVGAMALRPASVGGNAGAGEKGTVGTVVVLVDPALLGGPTIVTEMAGPGEGRWTFTFETAEQARECRDRGVAAMNAYRASLHQRD